MTRKNQVMISIIISFLILSPIITTDWAFSDNAELEKNSITSNAFIEDLLPNPFFDSEPNVTINGTSGEFSSSYHASAGSSDVSYIEMDWTHVANTELDYRGQDPEGDIPDYNDFIYTYQDFEFSHEVIPSVAEIEFNYSVYLTGDFATGSQENNNLMYRIYVWVIDSSGNWYRIFESREDFYVEEYTPENLHLNYFNLIDIFGGMVEEGGVQEDPTDTVTLAIGLAPTYRFQIFTGNPWTFYDGSVSVRVSYADIYVIMDIPYDPLTAWQPTYNETYGTILGDVYPLYENASDEVIDECAGMKVDSDGYVYVTGNTRTPYVLSFQDIRYRNQFLLKYDPSLNRQWAVENDNGTQVRSMFIEDGYIYTTGYIYDVDTGRDLIITKWSSSGDRIWQKEWGGNHEQTGIAIGVQSNGTIYVICADFDFYEIGYDTTQILKFDNDGNFLWNRTSLYFWTLYDNTFGEMQIFDTFFEFTLNIGIPFGGRFYFNGTESYLTYGEVLVPDGEGGCYAAAWGGALGIPEYGTTVFLTHYRLGDDPPSYSSNDWRTNFTVSWPNGWRYALQPKAITLTPDDKIQLLLQHTWISYEFLLLTYDLEGNLLENRTIGYEHWPYYSAPIFMASGKSGLVYFAFTQYSLTIDSAD
ncbi:MAG: hypothetical protein E4H14_19735, partial [Candidatus Thorarchaeota archaeon]